MRPKSRVRGNRRQSAFTRGFPLDGGRCSPHRHASWRVMYSYVRPHRLTLLVGGGLSLLAGATGLALPLAVQAIVGDTGHHGALTGVLLIMTALVVANAGFAALGNYMLRRTAESVV